MPVQIGAQAHNFSDPTGLMRANAFRVIGDVEDACDKFPNCPFAFKKH